MVMLNASYKLAAIVVTSSRCAQTCGITPAEIVGLLVRTRSIDAFESLNSFIKAKGALIN